jgi:hypothetical protein
MQLASNEVAASPPTTRSGLFHMPLFRPGTEVTQNGRREIVSHVILRRRELMVYLRGHDDPVKARSPESCPHGVHHRTQA